MKIEISVIIPFYDDLFFLKKAISSVLKQSIKNYEIIIIHDNPKGKKNLFDLKRLIKRKRNIRLLNNEKNLGAGLSRNRGIKIAKGKFIAFLDSDDTWTKNKLLIQRNFMKRKNILASHTSYDILDIDNNFIKKRISSNLKYHNLLNSCDIGLSTVMINRKLFKGSYFFPNLKTKEDYVLWLKIAKKGVIFYGLKKTLTKWTDKPNSLSKSVYQKLRDAFMVYYKYEGFNFFKSLLKVTILSIYFLKKK
mgnify:FL=1